MSSLPIDHYSLEVGPTALAQRTRRQTTKNTSHHNVYPYKIVTSVAEKGSISSYNCQLRIVTYKLEFDLDNVKMNQRAKLKRL